MAVLTRSLWLSLLCIALSAKGAGAADSALQLQEQEIKAGLIYNFLKYTEWPASDLAQNKITVCLFEDDPFATYLQPMAGRTVNSRAIGVSNIHTIAEAGRCQLLVIDGDAEKNWPELRGALAGKHILTVSDVAGFSTSGGMIEFGRKDSHINVNLNMEAVVAAGLKVQDRLLKLVTVVHGEGT